ncbi:MAG: amino acid racemase [Woeseiaceae bacterium]
MKERKTVGVLGGMGPDATVDFMAKVIGLTDAARDQDHIHMIVDHDPTVPNRQNAILDKGKDPGPALARMAKRLEDAGADFLVIPCNTAHVFEQSILDAVGIPLVSIVEETVDALPEECNRVGLLATDGCMKAGIYQRALESRDIEAIEPGDNELQDLMSLVYSIKAGDTSKAIARAMQALANELVLRGAEAIIAGCTEIPLVLDESMLDVPLISSTDVLAARTVQLAKPE